MALRGDMPAAGAARSIDAGAPPSAHPGMPVTFRWEGLGDGVLYDFALVAPDGNVIWSTRTTQDSVSLPRNVEAQLGPGRYYWRTDALLPDLTSATTGQQPFQVAP